MLRVLFPNEDSDCEDLAGLPFMANDNRILVSGPPYCGGGTGTGSHLNAAVDTGRGNCGKRRSSRNVDVGFGTQSESRRRSY